MGAILNPKWCAEMERKVFSEEPVDITTSFTKATQWLIVMLTKANRGFKVVTLGAGVRRVTTDTQVCPKCNGTGRC
jgi:hypothetical protein